MKKKHDMILLGIVLLVVLILFGAYCPMEEIIGIPCPGCNMLTALYWLSKGNMEMASFYHPAVWAFIGYAVCVIMLWFKYRERMFQTKIFRICSGLFLFVFLGVYAYRMLTVFPKEPMQLNENAMLIKCFRLF